MFSVFKKTFGKKTQSRTDVSAAVSEGTITGPAVDHKLHTTPKLHEKFPQIRSLAVNLMISPPDYETEPTLNGRSFGPDSLAYFEFRCKNVECVHGGFDLSETISDAITKAEQSITGRRVCRGWHGKMRINQMRCHYELNFRININYNKN